MGRHNALHSLACSLRAKGGDEDEIIQQLMDAPCRHNASGATPDDEVRRIAKSVCDKYQRGEAYRRFEEGFFVGKSPLEEFAARRALSVQTLESIGVVGHEKMTGLLMSSKHPDKGFDFDRMIEFPMRDDKGAQVGRKLRRANCAGIWGASKDGKPALKSTNETSASGRKDGLFYFPSHVEGASSVLVVEGEIDWAAAADAGATAVVGTPGSGCGGDVVKYLKALLKGRDVILAPDGDDAGRKWLHKVGGALANAQCRVRVIIAEEGMDLDKRLNPCLDRAAEIKRLTDGAVEWIEEGTEAKEAKQKQRAEAKRAEIEEKAVSVGAVIIDLDSGDNEKQIADKVIAALGTRNKDVFSRYGILVRRGRDEVTGEDIIFPLPEPSLREEISTVCIFQQAQGRNNEPAAVPPPKHIVQAVFNRTEWPSIQTLRGIYDLPIVRPDGSIFQTPGIDAVTGAYYEPARRLKIEPIPDNPTQEDAVEAAKILLEPIESFPIDGPDNRAAWVSTILSIIGRRAISGTVPMTMIEANSPASGKDILATMIGAIVFGRKLEHSAYSHDDAEMEKRLIGEAISGSKVIYLGNIEGSFGLPCINGALTGSGLKGRLLSTNKMVKAQMDAVWIGTSNNPLIHVETLRRMIPVRIVSPEEKPEERDTSKFKIRFPIEYCLENRGKLARAAIIMLSAWLKSKETFPTDRKMMGSFEAWTQVIRGACIYAGLADPHDARRVYEERGASAGKSNALSILFQWLSKIDPMRRGVSCQTMIDKMIAGFPNTEDAKEVKSAMKEIAPYAFKGDSVSAAALGTRLKEHYQKRVGDLVLKNIPRNNAKLWYAEYVGEAQGPGAKIEPVPAPRQANIFGGDSFTAEQEEASLGNFHYGQEPF